jgi:hypothetical protein
LIICTGGTFAMHRHPDGVLRPTVNKLEGMLRSLDELKHPDIPTFDLVEWEEPMDSSDFSPGTYARAPAISVQCHRVRSDLISHFLYVRSVLGSIGYSD